MRRYSRYMTQEATYWPPGSNDGFGGVEQGDPEPIKCRWQSSNALFRDADGQEFTASSVVYLAHDVEIKGMLALGNHESVPDEAREIRTVHRTLTMDGRITLTKVALG